MSPGKGARVLRFEIPIESDEDLAALEGALLAARALWWALASTAKSGDTPAR